MLCFLLLACLSWMLDASSYQVHISTRNGDADTFTGSDPIPIYVAIRNTGEAHGRLPVSILPLDNHQLSAPLFTVTCNGEAAIYIGGAYKFIDASQTLEIKSGDEKRVDVDDLSLAYSLPSAGTCEVKVSLTILDGNRKPVELKSNEVQLTMKERSGLLSIAAAGSEADRAFVSSVVVEGDTFIGCTASQQDTLQDAMKHARSNVSEAHTHLRCHPKPGWGTGLIHYCLRYITWFGRYNAERKADICRVFAALDDPTNGIHKPVVFDCRQEHYLQNTAAYIIGADRLRTIYLCPAFWTAIQMPNSQAGILIYIVYRYVAATVLGIVPWDYSNGSYEEAKNVAIEDPFYSKYNPDSIEFFCENDPYLP